MQIHAVSFLFQSSKMSKSVLGPCLADCLDLFLTCWTFVWAYDSIMTFWQNSGHSRDSIRAFCWYLEPRVHCPGDVHTKTSLSWRQLGISFLPNRSWSAPSGPELTVAGGSRVHTQVPPGKPWRPGLCWRTAGAPIRGAAGFRTACRLIDVVTFRVSSSLLLRCCSLLEVSESS